MCGTWKGREKKVLEKELACPVRHKEKQVKRVFTNYQPKKLLKTSNIYK